MSKTETTAAPIERVTQEEAIAQREAEVAEIKSKNKAEGKFPLRIKEFQGKALVGGFFPWSGIKIKPGETFYAKTKDEARKFLDTGLVELVIDDFDPLEGR